MILFPQKSIKTKTPLIIRYIQDVRSRISLILDYD